MKLRVSPWREPHGYERLIFGVHNKEFSIPEEPSLRFRVNMAKRHFGYTSQTREDLKKPGSRTQTEGNFFSYEIWFVDGENEEFIGRKATFDVPFNAAEAIERIRRTYVDVIQEYAIEQNELENEVFNSSGSFI
jgi:hypothetical protein